MKLCSQIAKAIAEGGSSGRRTIPYRSTPTSTPTTSCKITKEWDLDTPSTINCMAEVLLYHSLAVSLLLLAEESARRWWVCFGDAFKARDLTLRG
jgi:hypothetical protein